MTPKHFYLLLLAVIAVGTASVGGQQDVGELQIPFENDNQFPPENHSDVIEGSGVGAIVESEDVTTDIVPPVPIEQVNVKLQSEEESVAAAEDGCPKPCWCRVENNDFVIECSGYDLIEIPSALSEKVTILNVQNNKITEIPKSLSSYKNLKVLNANNNAIMNVVPGSVSELPNLVKLQLANNRLLDYPNDLKNGFGLLKLEELDLGGNDIRTPIVAETFSKFESLRTLTLPSAALTAEQDVCNALPTSLVKLCTDSCENKVFDCKEDEEGDDEDLPAIPNMLIPDDEEDYDTEVDTSTANSGREILAVTPPTPAIIASKALDGNASDEFSFRSVVNQHPNDETQLNANIVDANEESSVTESPINVGAKTSEIKPGGVDKSVIGLVVAGMVVIVAAITIKKNWSSISKRFGSNSNSRTPNERAPENANGKAPEEVPLQDKSPV